MNRWVVSYDIRKAKRRRRVQKLIERYGMRVQFSVGEVSISESNLNCLLAELETYVREPKLESIKFFRVCESCWKGSIFLGKRVMQPDDSDIFVI